jgi:hypothetical protein
MVFRETILFVLSIILNICEYIVRHSEEVSMLHTQG